MFHTASPVFGVQSLGVDAASCPPHRMRRATHDGSETLARPAPRLLPSREPLPGLVCCGSGLGSIPTGGAIATEDSWPATDSEISRSAATTPTTTRGRRDPSTKVRTTRRHESNTLRSPTAII